MSFILNNLNALTAYPDNFIRVLEYMGSKIEHIKNIINDPKFVEACKTRNNDFNIFLELIEQALLEYDRDHNNVYANIDRLLTQNVQKQKPQVLPSKPVNKDTINDDSNIDVPNEDPDIDTIINEISEFGFDKEFVSAIYLQTQDKDKTIEYLFDSMRL
jgi:hypothetical protein